jgi:hypothetical protein
VSKNLIDVELNTSSDKSGAPGESNTVASGITSVTSDGETRSTSHAAFPRGITPKLYREKRRKPRFDERKRAYL